MELGRFETDHIYCEDSYMAIKDIDDNVFKSNRNNNHKIIKLFYKFYE